MYRESPQDTICAIATPPGAGGIGIVRVSGCKAFDILQKIWTALRPAEVLEARKLTLGYAQTIAGERLDTAMAVQMPGPATYTGEDVVEISCHGSPVVLSRILGSAVAAGARLAGPGEFTRRAFLAGKLDLAQAEAVCDLIHAEGERAARLAEEQLEGRLSREVLTLSQHLADIRAAVEAAIDFPEEGLEVENLPQSLDHLITQINQLVDTYREGRLVSEGVRVAIVGKPNAGKSSILNRLCGRERAIVHHTPGTTRDVIEERAVHSGIVFHLRDTAGIREAASEVEAIGVARTHEEVRRVDLLLLVLDGSRLLDADDRAILKLTHTIPTLTVVNKSDLPQMILDDEVRMQASNHRLVHCSATQGHGIDVVIETLVSLVTSGSGLVVGSAVATVTNMRHKEALDVAASALQDAKTGLEALKPMEFAAQHLRVAQEALGTITGEVTTEALLDRIFSRFCIGK